MRYSRDLDKGYMFYVFSFCLFRHKFRICV